MYHNLSRITLLVTTLAIILAACGAPITEQKPIATLAPATEAATAAASMPFTHTACAAGVDLTGTTVSLYHIIDPNDQVETVYDPLRAGYADAAEYFNAHGGICGATLQQVFDDKNWGDSTSIYALFSALDPKPTVVTIYGSGAGEQLADQLAKDQIPALNIRGGSSASAYGKDGQTLGWVFATNPLYADQVGAVCDYIVANPDRFPNPVMGFMNSEDAWARTATEESRGYCESLGIGYARASYFSGNDTYLVFHVQNLIDAGANIIYTNSHQNGPALVARTLTEMGLQDKVTLATVNRAMDPYIAFSGEADLGADGLPMISGMIGSLPVRSWAETDNPGIQLITQQADLHQRPLTMRTDGYIMGWKTTDLLIEVYIQTGNRVGFDHIIGADVKETLENIVYAPLNGVERIDYQGGTRRALAENRIGEMNFLGQDGKTPAGAGNPPTVVKVGDQEHLVPMVIPLTDYQPAPDLRPGGADVPAATDIAPTNTPQSTSTTSTTELPVSPLVGNWQRVNSCASFVQAFEEAGLIDLAPEWLVGGGYFTSLDQIDNTNLCNGATEVVHSHFFTADGRFGSHDEMGRQVDDGRYRMVDDRTITFLPAGDVTVHFNIEGETLMFEVVVPEPCEGSCREATAWALSAFYPGPFQHVP